ncbi:MerR family transcriptional regulator [Aphanothece hegewaldii CCALA 016]|uniref:MerR family transcriptional regulator n=1 Tax=Aphanothece hegewaldii CCALA 016 TaxID=2107694 RepID=A0A2T1LYJ0_9CHRO|nr:MerR family transcriptional regulator [Aphanothece hegewaldii]PSF37467.1 MerR family transcriptional regulator [Aphanothece hegewaldii CCALA 016]
MKRLTDIDQSQTYLLEEFTDLVNQLLPQYLPESKEPNEINPRLIRHYTTQGMLDEPKRSGKYAIYTYRHLLQILVIRRLLSEGINASTINRLATEKSNTELENLLTGGVQFNLTTAYPSIAEKNPLAYLQGLQKNHSINESVVYRQEQKADLTLDNTSSWIHIEVIPGLEIHIRSDFKYPKSKSEKQSLIEKLQETLKNYFNRQGK